MAAISLLKFEPALKKHLKMYSAGVIKTLQNYIGPCELPLLLKLMSVCPLPDLELERLLKLLRYSILSNIATLKRASTDLMAFQTALAIQCFTNEYIYSYTEDEKKALLSLEKKVKSKKITSNQALQSLLALASYKALNQYEWCESLVLTEDIQEVFTRQVTEPKIEKGLKVNLTVLKDITNNISSKVRGQYEESPYPRWVNLGLPMKPGSISNVVNQIELKLYDNKITETEQPEILYAGCGTGQHSIETAVRFKSSKVLAVDLSLSSLAYAKRKPKS